jgi:two-component system, OmpR family, sensor kinase
MARSPRQWLRRRWSLQTRLMVTVIGFVSVLLVAIGFATGAILNHILQDNLTARLTNEMQLLRVDQTSTAAEILTGGRQEAGFLLVVQNFSNGPTSPQTVTGAYVGSDLTVHTMTSADQSALIADLRTPGDPDNGAVTEATAGTLGKYRLMAATAPGGTYVIIGIPTSTLTQTVTPILTTVAGVTVGGLLLLAIILTFVIRRSFAPLRAVADTATRVAALPLSEGDVSISERVPNGQTDDTTEIGRVGLALNTLLDHVDESLAARHRNEERMRQFVADASHELRTPLASIRGYSELSLRAMRQAPAMAIENTEQALERIQAQSLRMSALVEDLLLLARLEEGQELVYSGVDLTRVTVEALGDVQHTGPDHTWVMDVAAEPIVVAGDAARLSQVIVNLLANARAPTPRRAPR